MVDALEHLWPQIKKKYNPHTLVLNMDNGPENNSSRTQFMKRIVDFSQYNSIERVWGRLEKHWNGELLDSIPKILGLARTMTWNGHSPVVNFITKYYRKGVKLTKAAMKEIEETIHRINRIEKWAVDVLCYSD